MDFPLKKGVFLRLVRCQMPAKETKTEFGLGDFLKCADLTAFGDKVISSVVLSFFLSYKVR